MTPLGIVVRIVIALAAIEAAARILVLIANRVLRRPIPDPAAFFADQTRMLGVLINDPERRDQIDPLFGWSCRRGFATDMDAINEQGLRARHVYGEQPTPGLTRLAVFGDSYAYSNEVANEDSWPAQIESGWCAEVLNYGVGGYGADQALMRYEYEGRSLAPSIVLMGFTSMIVPRMVSRYRRFQDPRDGPWFKPRFVLGDTLRLVPPPLPTREAAADVIANPARVIAFGVDDAWYSRTVFESSVYRWSHAYRLAWYPLSWLARRRDPARAIFNGQTLNPGAEAFRLTVAVYRRFADAVRANGAEPVLVLLPGKSDVEMMKTLGAASYAPFGETMHVDGLRVIDLAPYLAGRESDVDSLFRPGGHCSPEGNALMAHAVATELGLQLRRAGPNRAADIRERS